MDRIRAALSWVLGILRGWIAALHTVILLPVAGFFRRLPGLIREALSRLLALLGSGRDLLYRKTLFPLMRGVHGWIGRRLPADAPPQEAEAAEPSPAEWKAKALRDFGDWLADLPEEPEGGAPGEPDACDLFTLLGEFSALRQEIRLQNREQNRAARVQESLIGSYREVAEIFESQTRHLETLERDLRRSAEKQAVLSFLELGDALARGQSACRAAAAERGLFRRPPRAMEGVVEGYAMALRRFDRALAQNGVTRIETVGNPFDPATMRAVERREAEGEGEAAGVVLEERLSGFAREEEVIRIAEVVVSG